MSVVKDKQRLIYDEVNRIYKKNSRYTLEYSCNKAGICKQTYYNYKKNIEGNNTTEHRKPRSPHQYSKNNTTEHRKPHRPHKSKNIEVELVPSKHNHKGKIKKIFDHFDTIIQQDGISLN